MIEHGKVIEVGSHDELITLGGRYKTMFELQASRFAASDDDGAADSDSDNHSSNSGEVVLDAL